MKRIVRFPTPNFISANHFKRLRIKKGSIPIKTPPGNPETPPQPEKSYQPSKMPKIPGAPKARQPTFIGW
ncbi:MAG TPA: hypothetical protein VE988_17780 [Gemmataceae bacterium]|nr:hypothetical protein [Gemmataceae bacterium]